MKVYQGGVIDWERSKERNHGQCRAIVAAPSWKAAYEIVKRRFPNMSLYHMRGYWTITGNSGQITAANLHPGKLLLSSSLQSDDYELAVTEEERLWVR